MIGNDGAVTGETLTPLIPSNGMDVESFLFQRAGCLSEIPFQPTDPFLLPMR